MFSIILWCLLAYFLYRFIVGFLIPVIRVTRQMKKQVRDFQQHANQQFSAQQGYESTAQAETKASEPSPRKGDYIDFEEIKD